MFCDAFRGDKLGLSSILSFVETPIRLRAVPILEEEPAQSTSNAPTAPTTPTAAPTIWSWWFAAPSDAVGIGTAGIGSGVVNARIGTLVGAREGAYVRTCESARLGA